jgi:DNA-binding MarR family transcriptional regulator
MLPVNGQLEFCLAVARAHAALTRRFDGRLGAFHGISFADFALLRQLSGAPGGRLRRVDLAQRLGLTPSAVTRGLIPLEKVGLVRREPDPNDARVSYATLTAAGRRILEEAVETANGIGQEALPDGARRLNDLSATLERLGG